MRRHWISVMLVCLLMLGGMDRAGLTAAADGVPPREWNYITRSGDRLMDGEKEFRFISMNGSNLTYMPAPVWHRPDPWEQEDVFRSLQQMGGNVVRLYTFTIKGGTANGDQPSHVTGLRQYNEDYFRDLDHVLKLANEYHIRVIIPFIDTWEHVGGIKQFAGFRGKTAEEFYTDSELKEDYKHLVSYVLNRTNTYTGIKYKDDKAILAWETGNELYPKDAWTQEMSAYIKSMDSNHIVMDGRYGISQASLEDPNVDIVSNHYYESGGADYALRAAADRNLSLGIKAFVIGEFGHSNRTNLTRTADEAIANGTSGALLWTLKSHSKDGGFYNKEGDFRWPGFPSGETYDEKAIMTMIREKAHEIRGLPVPPMPIPDAPQLLPIESVLGITWRGSAGAESYQFERAEHPDGPWAIIGTQVLDSDIPFRPFQDTTAAEGMNYYYRVKGMNGAGISEPSNVVGPITASSIPPVPDQPMWIPFTSVASMTWHPVKWAESYDIERAEAPNGPWTVVGADLAEADQPFKDASASSGIPYYYRITANNTGGASEPSEIFGPITVRNIAQLATLTVDSTNGSNVKEYAVDGNLSTRWLSQGQEENHFIEMEWTVPQKLNYLKIWSGATSGEQWHIRDFSVDYWNGTVWVPVTSVVDNDKDGFYGEYNDMRFETLQTTALRLNITKPSWQGIPVNPNDKIARLMDMETGYNDDTAPMEVNGEAVVEGDGQLTLNWTDPEDDDFAQVVVLGEGTAEAEAVHVGKGVQTVTINGLVNGTEYAYRIRTVDEAGNRSSGVTVLGTPGADRPGNSCPGSEKPDRGKPSNDQTNHVSKPKDKPDKDKPCKDKPGSVLS